MPESKNAHPDAATSERAGRESHEGRGISQSDCTTGRRNRRAKVSDLLHEGAENGITLQELVRLTGRSEREIRRSIHLERRSGTVIISDNVNGYFLPANSSDLRRFARSMAHRAGEVMAVARVAEAALAEAEGQSTVDGW